jgi:hypothetical protein
LLTTSMATSKRVRSFVDPFHGGTIQPDLVSKVGVSSAGKIWRVLLRNDLLKDTASS